jgi:4-amino-4-deoxy-L-arabinose transferase-like glycosyltransferase
VKVAELQPDSIELTSVVRAMWKDRILLFLMVLALALRLPWMSRCLWYDEISVTKNYLKNIFHLLDAWTWDSNMPVHYTIMFFWDKIFQDTEFSLRFPPLLFSLGAILLSYQVAKKIFDRKIALLTCLLLSISPVHIWYSAEARPYAGMMFFLLLAFLAFLKLQESEALSAKARFAWFSIYFVCLFLGTFSHFYMAIPVVVFSGISVLLKKRTLAFLALNGVILLLLACFLWFKHRFAGYIPTAAGYLRPFSFWEAWLLFFNWYSTGNTLSRIGPDPISWRDLSPAILCYQFFFFALFVKGIVVVIREQNRSKGMWEAMILSFLFCIPIFLLVVNVIGRRSIYIERSCYVALPFFFMIIANAVMPVRKNGLSILLFSGLLLMSGISTFWFFRYPYICAVASCKPDWRSAASYLIRDIGVSRQQAAIVGLLADRSLPYYDNGFADHVRLERLHQHLPPMLKMAKNIFGPENLIVDSFKNEMQDINDELKKDNTEKIAVLSLAEVSQEGSKSYDVLYATANLRTSRKSKRVLNWLKKHDYQLTEEQTFLGLQIYKFQRKRNNL